MLIFSNTGILAPSTEEVKLQIENVFRIVFGEAVNLSPQSVNGLLIQELTNNLVENNNNSLSLFNNYSIQNANGIFLDFIGLNYNIVREKGNYSVIQVRMLGASGTVIAKDIEISDNLGNLFKSIDNYIIGVDGTVLGYFQAQVFGDFLPIANTVTNIITFVIGLDSVTNTGVTDTAGNLPESDDLYRERIVKESFDTQRGTYRSLESALSKISTDFIFLENYTNIPKTINGVDIDPHSIWISSNEGTNVDIAQTIYDFKAVGCGLVGDVIVNIDTYEIKFNRPTLVNVDFVVNVDSAILQPPNIVDLIKNTILETIKSISKIGKTLYASDFICALNNAGVINIELLTINGTQSVESTILELLTTTVNNITVNVGG